MVFRTFQVKSAQIFDHALWLALVDTTAVVRKDVQIVKLIQQLNRRLVDGADHDRRPVLWIVHQAGDLSEQLYARISGKTVQTAGRLVKQQNVWVREK